MMQIKVFYVVDRNGLGIKNARHTDRARGGTRSDESGWVEQVRARLGGIGRIHETNLPYKIFLGKNYCMGWCDKLKWWQVREGNSNDIHDFKQD